MIQQQEEQVKEFIHNFLYKQESDIIAETLRQQFRCGYCWHFANILRDTFHRGELYWTAPFGHIVWYDNITKKYYDIEGEYEQNKHDAFYMIPIKYLGEYIRSFMHIKNDGHIEKSLKKSELIEIVKSYCSLNNLEYNKDIENYMMN